MSQVLKQIHPDTRKYLPDIWKGFDLSGMVLGETFMGCEGCGLQLTYGDVELYQCPVCSVGMATYTVTQQDLDATPK